MARREKRQDKKNHPWEGIRISEERLCAERESRVRTLLVKALIVYFLVGGGMGCVLSALDTSYHAMTVQLVILLASLFLASLYYRKWWENLGYLVLFFVMAAAAYILRTYINSGFYGVLNDMAEEVSVFFDSNAMRSYGEKISDRPLAITVSMAYIGIVCCVVANILISRRMRYVFVAFVVSGCLFMPLYLELEPNLFHVVQLFTALFLASSLRRGRHYALRNNDFKYEQRGNRISYVYASRTLLQAGVLIAAMVLAVAVGVSLIVPKDTYHERHPATAWKNRTKDTVENLAVMGIAGLFNYYPNTGGMTSGRLGGVSAIRYDYNTDLTLTFVPHSAERFYLKQFVGENYLAGENRWSRGKTLSYSTERAMSWAYRNKAEHSGSGKLKVENIAAAASAYLPYYSTEEDKVVLPGRSQTYLYYTGDTLGNSVMMEDLARWMDIPEENKAVLEQTRKAADLHGTPEEIVEQLAQYYEREIPYSYQPGATPRGEDFVNYFLAKNRRGYCAHFASAATLLFRYMGIPARYIEGYAVDASEIAEEGKVLEGETSEVYYTGYNELGQTGVVQVDVTDANAHAWVEIYLAGKGWRVVDITPPSGVEESTGNLWDLFVRFFGTGSDGGQITTGGDNQNDTTDRMKRTAQISIGVVGMLFGLAAFILLGRWLLLIALRCVRYRHSGRNDRLILRYQRYVRKMGHKKEAFARQVNYAEQLRFLTEHDLIRLTEAEQQRAVRILEQAGFGASEIAEEDALWIRNHLRL